MGTEFYTYKKNDLVRVRDGYKDSDTDADLSGWTGTVRYAETGGTVLVKWTQDTLNKMPREFVEFMDESDLGREEYELYETDLEPLSEDTSYTENQEIIEELPFPKSIEITAVPEKFRVITHLIVYAIILIPYTFYWGYVSYYAILQILEGDFEFVKSWMGFLDFAMVNLFMLILVAGLIRRINMLRKLRHLKERGVRTFVEIIRAKHRSGRLAAQFAEFEFKGKFVRQQLSHIRLAKLKKGDRIEIIYLPDKPEILTMVKQPGN